MATAQSRTKWIKIGLLVVLVLMIGGTLWYVVHSKNNANDSLSAISNASNQATKTTGSKSAKSTTKTTSNTPATLDKSVESYPTASLFQKCVSNDVTDSGTWGDSTASVAYYDFNGDKIEDVLVYAKIPGTMGYSQACVFTVKAGTLTQLWRIAEADLLPQSDISLKDNGQVVYSGKQETGSGIQDAVVYYQWSNVHNTLDPQD